MWLKVLSLILVFSLSVMARNLDYLITPLNPLAYYPMTDLLDYPNDSNASVLEDKSGNAFNLAVLGTSGVIKHAALNNRPGLLFNEEDPLQFEFDAPVGVKHLFIVAMADGANFDAYRGLISGMTSNSLLLGDSGQTKFFNLGFSGFNYYKSGTSYIQTNQQAPFNAFELIEMSVSGGVSLDGVRLGQDKADIDRRWKGYALTPILFTDVLTLNQRRRVNLYYDLKYSFWKKFGVQQYEMYFPSPAILPEVVWFYFREVPPDWEGVTIKHTYDDEGVSFMDTTDTPPQYWDIEYTGLSPEKAEIFDEFYNQVRKKHTFKFIAKDGTEHSGVRIDSYDRNHKDNLSKIINVKIRLVKYP